jgi:alkanesulfonate monooxygenase SsuD/methylene tetrahydromethanopterin reductase-like flavin-dependent oxidoreductase (luciferase family)
MKIGIGLPNPVPGTPGRRLVEWAQQAEERGFSGLATIDRLVYPSQDSLATLAAVAGATQRVELMTNILVAPLYHPVLLAKTAATIHSVSDGRFTLGLGVGGRADDFVAAERDLRTRGKEFDAALQTYHDVWSGGVLDGTDNPIVNPVPGGGVPILIGGTSDQAIERTVKWGAGWTAGGSTPQDAGVMAGKVKDAWRSAGREGEPRLAALAYFSLGADVEDASRQYLRDYYAFIGEYADHVAAGALRSEQAIRDALDAYAEAGITEVYFDPTTADLAQVDRLADVALA